jgi:hypothetical protein
VWGRLFPPQDARIRAGGYRVDAAGGGNAGAQGSLDAHTRKRGRLSYLLVGVQVSKATARRATLGAGGAALTVLEQEAKRLKQELPRAPTGAAKQAMVPLVGGEWGEVKTLVLGEVTRKRRGDVCQEQLSSFSRLSAVERFEEDALVETHRRGVEKATAVCAVQDGAEWLTGLVDYHRADAVRILDFAHAAEHISAMGQAAISAGSEVGDDWLTRQLHALKHTGPSQVLADLRALQASHPDLDARRAHLAYLEKREAQMQYPTFQAAGWPIGSGCVESANKQVVEARLKGAGMHWEHNNVNPLVVFRNAVCNQRWDETWKASMRQRQHTRKLQRGNRTQARCEQALVRFLNLFLWCKSLTPRPPLGPIPPPVNHPTSAALEATPGPHRPAANHPWRRPLVVRPKEGALAK